MVYQANSVPLYQMGTHIEGEAPSFPLSQWECKWYSTQIFWRPFPLCLVDHAVKVMVYHSKNHCRNATCTISVFSRHLSSVSKGNGPLFLMLHKIDNRGNVISPTVEFNEKQT